MAPTLGSNILDVVLINNIDKISDKQPREHFSTSDHNVVSFGFNLSNKKWLPELLPVNDYGYDFAKGVVHRFVKIFL